MKNANVVVLDQKDYLETYELQKTIHRLRVNRAIADTLLLVEHPPVYTIGRDGGWDHLKVSGDYLHTRGIEVHEVDRGGSITFHGPGQVVAYPVFNLDLVSHDLLLYLRRLEEVVIRALIRFNLQAGRFDSYPGVWVGRKKIAAIGVGCRKAVAIHGLALNVNTDLDYFRLINPCGISAHGVTSLAGELGMPIPLNIVRETLINSFEEVFGLSLKPRNIDGLIFKARSTYADELSVLVKN